MKLVIIILSLILTITLQANEFEISGKHIITRGKGKSTIAPISFSAPVEGSYYFIKINNAFNSTPGVTSSSVFLNGTRIFKPSDFNSLTSTWNDSGIPLSKL